MLDRSFKQACCSSPLPQRLYIMHTHSETMIHPVGTMFELKAKKVTLRTWLCHGAKNKNKCDYTSWQSSETRNWVLQWVRICVGLFLESVSLTSVQSIDAYRQLSKYLWMPIINSQSIHGCLLSTLKVFMDAYHQLFKYSKHIQKNEINHVHTHSKHLQLFLFMQSFVWQIH